MSQRFDAAATRFLSWMSDVALPFWLDRARDPRGGFFEAISHAGLPAKEMPKRLRVQARQAFSFARAEQMGLIADGKEASDHAFSYLLEVGRQKDKDREPGFVHILTPEGRVKDYKVDTYDHAFIILACAERIRAYRDEEARAVLFDVMQVLERIRHPDGGFAEGIPAELPRRQNPHMHLFEAFMNLRGLDTGFDVDTEIDAIRELFTNAFFDPGRMVIREFFEENWELHHESGLIVEPGHMAEWAWLISEDGQLTGYDFLADSLVKKAIELGQHKDRPLLANSIDLGSGEKSDRYRMWPQTELARAHLLNRRDDPEAFNRSADVIEAIFASYLNTKVEGGWYDEIDSSGQVVSRVMPSSTLYHLITLADEVNKALQDL